MYRRVIVDELGCVIAWCDEFESEEEIDAFLSEYTEARLTCVEI